MAEVRLQNIVKEFPGGVRAVDGISLDVADGDFLVLVGPSGCGKTTTLRMIAGLEEVTSGAISIGPTDVTHLPPKDRDVSMVFQNYALWPHMTVRQNLSFGLRLRHRLGAGRLLAARLLRRAEYRQMRELSGQIEERVIETARLLGIEPLLERKPRALSGGQQQRVAVGRALVRHPKAFLFDEPLSNLDAKLRVELRRELRALHGRLGATMIYVTHDQVEAMTLGTRIAVMDRGRIRHADAPLAVYDRPKDRFVAAFMGSPPMNLIEGALRADEPAFFEADGWRLDLPAEWKAALAGRQERRVSLGVRPEHVLLEADRAEALGPLVRMEAEVALAEPLGDETIVHLAVGAISLAGKADAHRCPAVGSRVEIFLPLGKLHVFDAETEERIEPGR